MEIADEISRDFGVDAEVALNDLREFLGALKTHHLVAHCGDKTQSPNWT